MVRYVLPHHKAHVKADGLCMYLHILCTYILFEYGTYLLDGPWASIACIIDLMLDRAPRATMILENE